MGLSHCMFEKNERDISYLFNVCTTTIPDASGIPGRRITKVDLTQTMPPYDGGKSNLSN